MRTTEFAAALAASPPELAPGPAWGQAGYGPPQFARSSQMGGLLGTDFLPQAGGTLRCPAGYPLYPQVRRPERNGTDRGLVCGQNGP